MAIRKGAEAIEVALANTLRTNLPAQLAAISAAWNDGTPLPNPALVHGGRLDLIREFPTVVVSSLDGRETADGASIWGQQDHRLDVAVIAASDEQSTLDRIIKRYLVAIWEVLKANQNLDGSLAGLGAVGTRQYGRSGTYPSRHKPLLEEAAAWEVVVQTLEAV